MKRILIVEDDELLRQAIGKKLTANNFSIDIAADGRIALEIIAKNVPDLILLDIIMPVMDGISFLKEIKKTEYRNIPIIILTNLTDDAKVAEALENNVTDYLIKTNYSLESLVALVKEKLGL